MNWTQFLKTEAERTYATTAKLIDRVDPASLSWKPPSGSNWMTVGQLLKHLTDACGSSCKGFITGDWGLPEGARMEDIPPDQMLPPAEQLPAVSSLEEARQRLYEDEKLAVQMVELAGEEELAHRAVEVPWAPGVRLPLGFRVHQMIQHLDRHKAQLFYYLKLQGVPVNTEDLWGQELKPAESVEAAGAVRS